MHNCTTLTVFFYREGEQARNVQFNDFDVHIIVCFTRVVLSRGVFENIHVTYHLALSYDCPATMIHTHIIMKSIPILTCKFGNGRGWSSDEKSPRATI